MNIDNGKIIPAWKVIGRIYSDECWQNIPKALALVIKEDLFEPGVISWINCSPVNFREDYSALAFGSDFNWNSCVSERLRGSSRYFHSVPLNLMGIEIVYSYYVDPHLYNDRIPEEINNLITAFFNEFNDSSQLKKIFLESVWHLFFSSDEASFIGYRLIIEGDETGYRRLIKQQFVSKNLILDDKINEIIESYTNDKYQYFREIELFRSYFDCFDDIQEHTIFWRARERYFSYFKYYLDGVVRPFFFIYQPQNRSYQYRGLVRGDIRLNNLEVLKRDDPDSFQLIQELLPDEPIKHERVAKVISDLRQDFRQGVIRWLADSKQTVWSHDVEVDFKMLPTSGKNLLLSLEEYRVIDIYGGEPNGPKGKQFLFTPLFCYGQFRGSLFLRFNWIDDILRSKINSTINYLTNYLGLEIESYFFETFRNRVSNQLRADIFFKLKDDDFVPIILNNLHLLLNVEAAGYHQLTSCDSSRLTCNNLIPRETNRSCTGYGFVERTGHKKPREWEMLTDKIIPSCSVSKDGSRKCFLERLLPKCNELFNILKTNQTVKARKNIIPFNAFPETIDALREELASHFGLDESKMMDIDQSFDPSGAEKRRKTIICWLIPHIDPSKDCHHFFWAAVDLTVEKFIFERKHIEDKIVALDSYMIDYSKTIESYGERLYRLKIESQKHNIRNTIPLATLDTALYDKMEPDHPAYVFISDALKRLKIMKVCLDIVYLKETDKELMPDLNDIKSMLLFMRENTPSVSITPSLIVKESFGMVPLTYDPNHNSKAKAFNLLWNLWDNAKNYKEFTVTCCGNPHAAQIIFRNLGRLEPEFIEKYSRDPKTYSEAKLGGDKYYHIHGIDIIIGSIADLNWEIRAKVENDFTEITVTIPR